MSNLSDKAIKSVQQSDAAWCRFITGNDTGATGSHQSGFYVPKCASALLFSTPGKKGENKEKNVKISWQDSFITESRMKYYGQGTRNEYRITRFGRDFPFLQDDNVGDLLVLAKYSEEDYCGYVLHTDEDIDSFLSHFNISSDSTNQLIDIGNHIHSNERLIQLYDAFAGSLSDFPTTRQMSEGAQTCYNQAHKVQPSIAISNPDDILLNWIDTEFSLFKYLENKLYADIISRNFSDVDAFVQIANEVLNRRKSRAGKSLEHHLSHIFHINQLIFEEQAMTEDNKRPDFLFPNSTCYHNLEFPARNIIVLGAKTTCKDRWRQVLTEANRTTKKYLFTLQQGVSRNQLKEMHDSGLTLVAPKKYISCFPIQHRHEIMSLSGFISMVHENQNDISNYFFV